VNLANRYRLPVVLLLDEVIAHMREKVSLPSSGGVKKVERKKPTCPPKKYLPYEITEDDIPPMANFGEGYRYHVTGLTHDPTGFPTSDTEEIDKMVRRLYRKIERHQDVIIRVEGEYLEDAEILVFAYGSVARSAISAVKEARGKGIKAGLLRPISLWPFPDKFISRLVDQLKAIIVAEMNLGQMIGEVRRVSCGRTKTLGVMRVDGELITPDEILVAIEKEAS
jgi:2-oxoglutarate ferredoxin oxidoreductase subunit alpha